MDFAEALRLSADSKFRKHWVAPRDRDTRVKSAEEGDRVPNLPELKDAVSLKEAMKAGGGAVRKLVSDMLGSLRFSEIAEPNELWQSASNKETISYSESQAAFRKLIGSDNAQEPANIREAAETLRRSLKAANVEVIPKGNSFKLRLDDSTFRL